MLYACKFVWSLCVWTLARNLYLEGRARRLCLFIVHWELVWKVWTLIFRTEFPEKCSCLTCFNLNMLTDLCRYSVIATGLRSSQNVRQMLLVCSPLHSCSKGNLYFPEQDLFWVIAYKLKSSLLWCTVTCFAPCESLKQVTALLFPALKTI
jgi:hypothetical protein